MKKSEITFRRAAWDFLRGLKVMEKVDEIGLENAVVPPGGFFDKDGEVRPSPFDAMSYEDFHAAVAKLAHIEHEEEAVIDVIANTELMARLELLAREIAEGPGEVNTQLAEALAVIVARNRKHLEEWDVAGLVQALGVLDRAKEDK